MNNFCFQKIVLCSSKVFTAIIYFFLVLLRPGPRVFVFVKVIQQQKTILFNMRFRKPGRVYVYLIFVEFQCEQLETEEKICFCIIFQCFLLFSDRVLEFAVLRTSQKKAKKFWIVSKLLHFNSNLNVSCFYLLNDIFNSVGV